MREIRAATPWRITTMPMAPTRMLRRPMTTMPTIMATTITWSNRRQLDRMIVVAVTIGCMIVMRIRGMGVRHVSIRAVRVIVMLDRVAARIARMRAEYRDQTREYGADQRQKDDCLDH